MGKHTWTALALITAASCTPSSALRTDVAAYVQRMETWAPVEAETARSLERILATQFVDSGEVLRQIRDSQPRTTRHLEEIRKYRPRTAEVRRIHERYIQAWQALLAGYTSIDSGLARDDQALIAAGRQSLLDWRRAILDVARELRDLSDQFQPPYP